MSGKSDAQVETLVQFFGLKGGPDEKRERNVFEKGAGALAAAPLAQAISLVPGPLQDYARASLDEALKIALDVNVKAIFAKAWNTRKDLLRYGDRSKYPPTDVIDYALKETAIDYGYKPAIQLELDGKTIGPEIHFEVSVELICAPILKIRDAHIIGARTGTIQGKGAVKCENMTVVERKSEPFTLPGDLSFGEGFAIGKPYNEALA